MKTYILVKIGVHYWCAILIAHQFLWQNMEAPVSIFRNLHLRENLAKDCFLSTASTVTNSVQHIYTNIFATGYTNLFATGYNLNDIISQIYKEIDNVYAWVKANLKLSLNIEKNNFMLFMPKCVPRTIKGVFIAGNRIMKVTETKFLGVIIDYKLNWSPHITYIRKKVAKGVSIILKARKLFDQETLLRLYYTFVYPYLNYCIHVWGKAYNVHIHDLIVLQNKAMRIVHGVPPRTNAQKNMLPELFENFFSNLATIHEHDTRSARLNHIYIQLKETTRGQKAFSYSGAFIWNFILSYIETDCAIGTIKKLCTALLLNSKEDLSNSISTNMDSFHVSVPKCICLLV